MVGVNWLAPTQLQGEVAMYEVTLNNKDQSAIIKKESVSGDLSTVSFYGIPEKTNVEATVVSKVKPTVSGQGAFDSQPVSLGTYLVPAYSESFLYT